MLTNGFMGAMTSKSTAEHCASIEAGPRGAEDKPGVTIRG
jgi:hypothetical protein